MSYPEHDKLAKVRDRSQEIGEFLEWLDGQKIVLSRHSAPRSPWDRALQGINQRTESLLAEYFGIDLQVLEAEKREMLSEIRKEES